MAQNYTALNVALHCSAPRAKPPKYDPFRGTFKCPKNPFFAVIFGLSSTCVCIWINDLKIRKNRTKIKKLMDLKQHVSVFGSKIW